VCLVALVCWSLASYLDVATSPELQRDDWRSVADALPDGAGVVVYPAYQSAALTRQRPDLVEQAEPEELDTIVLVLAGFDEPPSSFRVPDGFAEARVDEIQHFRVAQYRRETPAVVRPGDVARGPLDDSDLQVLVVGRSD
jgi:hypothetical protein